MSKQVARKDYISREYLKKDMIRYGWKHVDSTVTEYVDGLPGVDLELKRPLTLTLRSDAYGDVCVSVTVMTTKSTEELSDFIDQFFDIAEKKNMHGYHAKSNDGYKIVEYLKKKFKYSDDEMITTKPEVIVRYY